MKIFSQAGLQRKILGSLLTLLVAVVGVFISSILSAQAAEAPTITSSIRNVAESVVTSAPIGAVIHNVVTVASSTGATPTGTVEFKVYDNTACTGTAASIQQSVALIDGTATSSAYAMGATGLSYKVHYNGDANNIATDENCVPVSATSGTVAVTQTLSTTTPVALATSVSDAVALLNVTANAGGTVAFVIYTDGSCTIPLQGAGIKTVTNGVVPNSETVVFNSAGTYRWQAVYSGDANNVAATSTCANAILVVNPGVKANTSITTTLSTSSAIVGTAVSDSAVLTGATANAGGTVAYTIYTDNTCSTALQGAGVTTVTNGTVPNSQSVTFNSPGTYYWRADYSGDANNNPSVSQCASGILSVNAAPVATTHLIVDNVTIPAADPTNFSFTTSGSGYAPFSLTDAAVANNQALVAGTYTVSETPVSGWSLSSALCSKNGGTATSYVPGSAITLTATDTVTCVFTNTKNATTSGNAALSGTVFNDLNKSGVKEFNETGIAGFTINLYSGAGWTGSLLKSTVTDANGNYSFTGLIEGTYSIEEVNQPTWQQFTSDFNSIVILAGVSKNGLDIANIAKTETGQRCDKHTNSDDDDKDMDDDCNEHTGKNRGQETKFWRFNNGHDNGLHLGWTKERKNSEKNHGRSRQDD